MGALSKTGERWGEDPVPRLNQEVGDTAPTPTAVPRAVDQDERFLFGHFGSRWLAPLPLAKLRSSAALARQSWPGKGHTSACRPLRQCDVNRGGRLPRLRSRLISTSTPRWPLRREGRLGSNSSPIPRPSSVRQSLAGRTQSCTPSQLGEGCASGTTICLG